MENRRRHLKIEAYRKFIFLISAGVFSACSSRPEPIVLDSANVIIQSKSAVELSDNQFNTTKMKLGKMVTTDFYYSIYANGMFDVPPENVTTVGTFFGGYVKEMVLLPGEKVKKGQVLMVLENPEYIQMQQEFMEVKGQLSFLKSDFERQKALMEDSITSRKKFLKAESEYKVTQAKYESVKKKLDLININTNTLSNETIRSTVSILSPLNGFVTEINVTRGMYLSPAFEALTITNTDHLHLELTIFEKDLPNIQVGQIIKFKTLDDPKEYDAKIFLINRSIDAEKRTISVHGDLVDESHISQFAPGMYVEARILTTEKKALSLPEEAVVTIDDGFYVLEKIESESGIINFERKEVIRGMIVDGYVEILNYKEFNPNSEFLVKGAFNLIKD